MFSTSVLDYFVNVHSDINSQAPFVMLFVVNPYNLVSSETNLFAFKCSLHCVNLYYKRACNNGVHFALILKLFFLIIKLRILQLTLVPLKYFRIYYFSMASRIQVLSWS